MSGPEALVGREAECARLGAALRRAREGSGTLVLISGEAGVARPASSTPPSPGPACAALRGAAAQGGTAPYGPLVGALRAYMRAVPGGLDGCGPLRGHLALLLPELGAARRRTATAPRCSRRSAAPWPTIARHEPAVVVLDDLHWSDEATLELLAALGPALEELPLARRRHLPLGRAPPRPPAAAPARRAAPRGRARRAHARAARRGRRRRARRRRCSTQPLSPRAGGHDPRSRRRACPSSSRSSRRALRAGGLLAAGDRRPRARCDATCPCRTRCATPCCCARRRCPATRARRPRRPPSPASASTSSSSRSSARGRRSTSCSTAAWSRESSAGARGLPPPARRATRSTTTSPGCAGARCTGAGRAARGARRAAAEVAAHWLGAHEEERARDALLRAGELAPPHAYRDAAAPGRQALELWPEGERGRRSGSPRSSATRASPSWPASWPRRPARSARSWRRGAARTPAARSPTPSAGWPRSTSCRATARARSRARRVAADAFAASGLPRPRPPPSGWPPPATCRAPAATPTRSS